jgi:multicomponent Na+:H+ antiporter subunit D
MMKGLMLIAVLLPICSAPVFALKRFRSMRSLKVLTYVVVLTTSAAVLGLCAAYKDGIWNLIHVTSLLNVGLNVDGMSRVFGCIVAILWPITTLYAFDYMKRDHKKQRFFSFFVLSYGAAVGIAFAGNLVTMYLFYEVLSLATLPLVMHKMDDRARYAGKRYMIYSIGGTAFGFIAVVFSANYGGASTAFALGGVLSASLTAGHEQLLRTVFTLAFFGFGVKAAIMPLSGWLPAASVAPTPVTALLHAVAVVKAGAFACIRLTYYTFGTDLLSGTFAQYLPMAAALFTIVYGSARALRTNHLKRRFAYSTVSNLSYILLGVTMMSSAGLMASAQHIIGHAFVKIALFFCIGAVLEKENKSYLDEIEGIGRRMPVTFACFGVASLALAGMPPLPIFFSKWAIGEAAIELSSVWGYVSVGALLVSTILTALYTLGIVIRAFFPLGNPQSVPGKRTETRSMNIAILLVTVMTVLLGLFSGTIHTTLAKWLIGGAA